ncbi:hypothetical protein [Methanobacterium sp. ACI-7]|uniref:hypothetical protein n=1 Tax=unclassified Methanobacterium TaxID=2627676 RepID=UPI0039C33E3C
MELGGGTIKRRTACALLLTISMAMCIIPSVVGTENQVASDNYAKIGLNEALKNEMFGAAKNSENFLSDKNVLEVNAASKTKKVKAKTKKTTKKVTTKKTRKKVAAKKTTKKVKAATYRVKVKYYYKGKVRYKYVTKYQTVSASSTTRPVSYASSSSSGSWSDDPTLDAIIRSGSGFSYSSAHHTGAELAKYGSGDCWAFSDYLNTKLQAAGYQSRVIQYATSYSSQHRSVQVMRNGAWQTVPYRAYGYPSLIV